jgi:hypothetical protein
MILLLALAATFAAFCVWLTVRLAGVQGLHAPIRARLGGSYGEAAGLRKAERQACASCISTVLT